MRFPLLVAALLAAVPVLAVPVPAPDGEAAVERVSFVPGSDGLVVRVETSERVRAYSVDQRGGTFELTLYRTRLAGRVAQSEPVWPVAAYRLETGDGSVTVRFEIDPSTAVQARPDRDSDDLLLTFDRPAALRPVAAEGTPREPVARRPTPRQPAAGPAPIAEIAPAPPAIEPAAVAVEEVAAAAPTVVPDGADRWRLDTIVLDAGHGAHDYGARANGTSDKEVALGVVSRLGPMIERELGVRVVYTRDDDTFVELRDRGRIANREGGKLFISVHANAAGSTAAHGTETFFLAPRGSSNAREVMERENSVIELESDPDAYADFTEGGDIIASLAMSAYQEESQLLARLIEDAFVRDGRHSRGVKQNNFIVLWAASMPAVLVEVGFVTNPDDARFLKSTDGLDRTARSIFEAVRAYKASYERGLEFSSAQ